MSPANARTPLLGDRVTFYPSGSPPIGAEITMVWSSSCVNVRCDDGRTPSSVLLHQTTAPTPDGYYCRFEGDPLAPVLTPHQNRVVHEQKELDERLSRLRAFMGTPLFANLDAREQSRMARQARIMGDLSAVLGERIHAFTNP